MVLVAKATHKKYANAKDYTFYDSLDNEKGVFKVDFICGDDELLKDLRQFAVMVGAVKCYVTWTAREGFCKKEVIL